MCLDLGVCRILIAVLFMLEFFHVQLVSVGFGTWKVCASVYLKLGHSQSVTVSTVRFADQLTELSVRCATGYVYSTMPFSL